LKEGSNALTFAQILFRTSA